MQLGHALIKEQLFFRRELIERVDWFIRLRWYFAVAGMIGVIALVWITPEAPTVRMLGVFLSILVYNGFFRMISGRLRSTETNDVDAFIRFAHVQITLDLTALFLIVFYTGGLYSPFVIFTVFHIIIAGILLSPSSCHAYSGIIISVIGGMTLLQSIGIFKRYPPLFHNPSLPHELFFPESFPLFLMIATALIITAALTTSIKTSLRTKGRELLRVSKELDHNNSKLTALYEMVKVMGLATDLQNLMDSATQNAARIMGVKGCSIKLLDDSRQHLRFASTFGLSGNYIAKASIDIQKSAINRSVIEGACHAVGHIHEKNGFQYPENILQEKISSMVCLPLKVDRMIFGVFCVYSEMMHFFKEEDIRFFGLMSDLTALAIENLKSELNKTWFLQKAAHQLRSPLDTVYSIMETLTKGYVGPVTTEQKEMLLRVEKRLGLLRNMIGDLLDLGIRRSSGGNIKLTAVDAADTLNALLYQFQVQASEKKIILEAELPETPLKLLGDKTLVDEVLVNLISNALKYTHPGGKISIVLDTDHSGKVRYRISDTGIGIPKDHMPHLFSEFARAANAKALTEDGSGLGLIIVKEILDRLKGSIHISSKEMEGTVATILLPSHDAAGENKGDHSI